MTDEEIFELVTSRQALLEALKREHQGSHLLAMVPDYPTNCPVCQLIRRCEGGS